MESLYLTSMFCGMASMEMLKLSVLFRIIPSLVQRLCVGGPPHDLPISVKLGGSLKKLATE